MGGDGALVERIREMLRPRSAALPAQFDQRPSLRGEWTSRIDEDYYLVDGEPKRFFDRASVDRLFAAGWSDARHEERMIARYDHPKSVWEVVWSRLDKPRPVQQISGLADARPRHRRQADGRRLRRKAAGRSMPVLPLGRERRRGSAARFAARDHRPQAEAVRGSWPACRPSARATLGRPTPTRVASAIGIGVADSLMIWNSRSTRLALRAWNCPLKSG